MSIFAEEKHGYQSTINFLQFLERNLQVDNAVYITSFIHSKAKLKQLLKRNWKIHSKYD